MIVLNEITFTTELVVESLNLDMRGSPGVQFSNPHERKYTKVFANNNLIGSVFTHSPDDLIVEYLSQYEKTGMYPERLSDWQGEFHGYFLVDEKAIRF
jgi:hypothetical protein